MTTQIKALLSFLHLTDPDGTLSLTSVLLVLAMVKFAVSDCNVEYLIALLGAAAAYQGKKIINRSALGAENAEVLAGVNSSLSDLTERLQVVENRTAPGRR